MHLYIYMFSWQCPQSLRRKLSCLFYHLNCNNSVLKMGNLWILLCIATICCSLEAIKADDDDCGSNPTDVVFVLDESGSIWGPDFNRQIKFVNDIIDMFTISKKAVHVGSMAFSDNARILFNLKPFRPKGVVKQYMNKTEQKRGGTKTHLALDVMRTTMFSNKYTRPGVPRVCVFITDGDSENTTMTRLMADKAKNEGIVIFAIGIGLGQKSKDGSNEKELEAIASPGFAFRINDYQALDSIKEEIGEKVCAVTTTPSPITTTTTTTTTTMATTTLPQMIGGDCPETTPLHVAFSLSEQTGIRDTELALDFTSKIVDNFNLEQGVSVSVTQRDCDSEAESIGWMEHSDPQSFRLELNTRKLSSANVGKQLEHMIEQIAEAQEDRQNAKQVAVLVVDNKVHDMAWATSMVEGLKEAYGASLIVIGVGEYYDKEEVRQLAGDDFAYFVKDYSRLGTERNIEAILDLICKGMKQSENNNY